MKNLVADYQVTNEELFYSLVSDVDTMGLKSMGVDYKNNPRGFRGSLSIDIDGQGWTDFTGEFGANDYADEYGFILKLS